MALEAKQRTLRVEIDFPNPTGESAPGMYAYGGIRARRLEGAGDSDGGNRIARRGPFLLPRRERQGGATPIKIGARQGTLVEVVQKQTKSPGEPARWESFTGQEWLPPSYPSQWIDGQAVNAAAPK